MTLTSFFLSLSANRRDLHSFPTRRSSDLTSCAPASPTSAAQPTSPITSSTKPSAWSNPAGGSPSSCRAPSSIPRRSHRSEEHTSELQSHSDLVCRLLLEKKINIITSIYSL